MKLKSFLVGCVFVLLFVGSAKAQTPEEIWQEYKLLSKFPNELLFYASLKEPYYSWALAELATKPNHSLSLSFIFYEMIDRLPSNANYLFKEFWGRFSVTAANHELKDLLINPKISDLPQSLNWFVDDVVDTLLRREINAFIASCVVCHGHKKYREKFLERFFAVNPLSFDLTEAVINCDGSDNFRELFLAELLKHPQVRKQNLINVLVFIDKFPKLYDQYFSLLLFYEDELDRNDIIFVENTCKTEPYCSLFSQLNLSAVLERKEQLIELMKKKQ